MTVSDPLPQHKKIAIFGLGASGIAAAHLLSRFGKDILASDLAGEDHRSELESKLPSGTKLILGHNEIGDASAIVTSPALEPSSPIFAEAKARGIPVHAELEIAALASRIPMIAITGTDGKTTTTTLTSHILSVCGISNKMGGNVGIPLAQVVQEDPVQCHVVETSAFQLVFCPKFHPHILIATNIAEDHCEYFKGDWQAYAATKRRSLDVMNADDIAILNASDPAIRQWNRFSKAHVCWYGMSREDIPNIEDIQQDCGYYENGIIHVRTGGKEVEFAYNFPQFRGIHNVMNILGAVLSALYMGCDAERIVQSIHSYHLPPHRIQSVCKHEQIEFIDDSKATNPHAGMAALTAIDAPTILIAGGVDKGLSLTDWMIMMKKNVRHIMIIGELSDRFCREAEENQIGIPIHRCETLEQAVSEAYRLAQNSDCRIIILSPGCSSYDMFKNYGQRGDVFASAARALFSK